MSTPISLLAGRIVSKITMPLRRLPQRLKTLAEIIACCALLGMECGATITFSNPKASSTVATFSSSGTYVISCTVSDSVLATKQSITIQVLSPIPAILGMDSPSGIAGTTVLTNVNLATGTIGISTLQFNLAIPSGVTISTANVTAGPAATAASKSVTASISSGTLTVIVFGLNQNVITTGPLVVIPLSVGVSLPTETASLALSSIVASDLNGISAPINGQNGTLSVTANAPPVVTISGPSSIILPGTASLSVTAADDGAPNPPGSLNYQWTSP